MSTTRIDVLVIGAGIVGLATARALLLAEPTLQLRIVEKEDAVATHQSGRNSGVIHSGIYYAPGSAKSRMVATGRAQLLEYARDRDISHEVCGKVVVATSVDQLGRLEALRARAAANNVPVAWVGRSGLADFEPDCDGLAALHVPTTGVINFEEVARALADDVMAQGGELSLGCAVASISESPDQVSVSTDGHDSISARLVVNCAGLQADRVAALAGQRTGVRIMPFRGEFLELSASGRDLVRHLIYPVPDPTFPFLGVHLTRGVDGTVHAGPNAVAAFMREGYRWVDFDREGLAELFLAADARRLARRYWRTGAGEVVRSLSHRAATRAVQRLVPGIAGEDLRPAGSGVRAQAVRPDGTLLDDFAFAESDRIVSVLNAPSPAATASLEIGREIATRVLAAAAAAAPPTFARVSSPPAETGPN